ncbi:MAG TPA: glycoside hydrolase family 130 protein [Panacibacter sp.]|nr:glycoside hydrolase family 130 protein [Panacibacter sp.]
MSKPILLKRAAICLLCYCCISCNSGEDQKNEQDTDTVTAAINNESTDWALLGFTKADSVNPILQPGNNSFTDPVWKRKILWEQKDVFNPAIVVKGDSVYMLYRAQDTVGKPGGTSRVGLAVSSDGFHFTRYVSPVLYPDNDAYKKYEWEGGCEDPRVVEDSAGTYYMTYTAYDGTIARLLVATSKDLRHWTKQGPVFAKAYNGKYIDKWSKSGSVVSSYKNGKIIATKINGKYRMYWGDQFIWAATSDDLINWYPVEMEPGEKPPVELKGAALTMPDLKIVIATRSKKFDSDLVESGPPAMLTDKGILLIYNSRNITSAGDTSLAEGTYAAGQVLLDRHDPAKTLQRLNNYFIKPDKDYEFTGQVNQVCFLEGMAQFKGKWFLYYGTADSKIAVAVRRED